MKWVKCRCVVPVYQHCATTHTHYILSTPSLSVRTTKSKSFILHSIQEVFKEICHIMVGMWAGGIELGFDTIPTSLVFMCKTGSWDSNYHSPMQGTHRGLMAWLDLSVWLRCRPECGYEEICYLLMWPFLDGPDRWHRCRRG